MLPKRATFSFALFTGVRVEVPSFGEDFTRAGWLKTNAALIAFQTEVAKYIYYRFKY